MTTPVTIPSLRSLTHFVHLRSSKEGEYLTRLFQAKHAKAVTGVIIGVAVTVILIHKVKPFLELEPEEEEELVITESFFDAIGFFKN